MAHEAGERHPVLDSPDDGRYGIADPCQDLVETSESKFVVR